jgi:hypothetical protein
MSGAVFTLGNSVSGSLSLGSALSKFGRVAGQAGFTIEQEEETLNNTVTSRYAGLAAVTVSGVTSVLNPSLVLIPSAYNTSGSTGILYSLHSKPNGVADFVVTRATEGTRFNSVGRISTVGSGDARLDYLTSGGTAGTPALLVEPAATNLAPNANLMNQQDTPTASGGVTFTTGSTDFLAPDGTNASINKYVGGAASGVSQYTRYTGTTIQPTASGTYTFSIFAKPAATNPLNFCAIEVGLFGGISPDPARSFFSLSSGTAITSGARIENYGNGWYRLISAPFTLSSADLSGTVLFNLASSSGSVSWAASGATNLTAYTWGSQFEVGSIATSYIPTTTSPVTRNADVISVSGAVSGCIGQTEGTLYAEVDVRNLGVETYFIRIDDGASTNVVSLRKLNTNNVRSAITAPTFSGTLNISSATFTAGILKIAFAYKSGEIALCVNGANLTANGTFTFNASFNRISIGSNVTAGTELNDRIRSLAIYTTRLTNAELQSLTTL